MAGPTLKVMFMADSSNLKKGVDEAGIATEGFKDKLLKIGGAIATAFVAKKVVDFAKDSIKAAQDLNANMSRTNTIFGDAAGSVEKWSESSAKSLRISQAEALGAANAVGKTLVGSFGMSGEAAAQMSTDVVELARDMAAFNRVPFDEALDKVTAGLNGQTRGLKTLGVNLDAAEIKQKAVQLGLIKQGDAVDGAAKAQATFALMLEKTTLQQGATERGAGSLKAKQEELSAEWKDAQATIGNVLLPVVTDLVTIFVDKVIPIIQVAAGIFERFSDVIIPVAGIIAGLVLAYKGWIVVQGILNAVMALNPLGLIIIAIAALVAGIVLLATKTTFFQDVWKTMTGAATKAIDAVKAAVLWVFDWVKNNWPLLAGILFGPIGLAVGMIVTRWDDVKKVVDKVFGWFRDLPGRVKDGLVSGFEAVISWFGGLAERILRALGNIDLFEAGKRILESLGRGIEKAGQVVIDKAQGIADKVKGLWPFSPAKWGPFAQAPPERAGRKLVELWAEGMESARRGLETTAARVAGGAALEPATIVGAGPSAFAPTATAAVGGPAVVIQNATFTDEADIDVFLRRVSWAASTGSI